MTPRRPLMLALLLAAPATVLAEAPVVARGSDLIAQLGADRYPDRVHATEALWQQGDEALPLLETAARSADPEVRVRAAELLRRIQLGITPDSPPEVVELVLRYDHARPAERQRIVRSLKALRAWRQVLRLHATETDPATLQRIESELERVPLTAARELLAGDSPDWDSALEFLEIARPDPAVLLMRAELHRLRGTLDEQLELAAGSDADALAWRRALQLVAGRLPEARRLSEQLGEAEVAARLAVLEGDPVPWLRQATVPDHEIPPTSLDAYRDAVIALWQGEEVPEPLARGIASMVRDELDDQSWHALAVLFGLGLTDLAEPLLIRLSPSTAFDHFESIERVDDALRALGFDPADPDYVGRCHAGFDALIRSYEEHHEEVNELIRIGDFLESRGMDEVLAECFVAPLVELGETNDEAFLEVIKEMFSIYRSTRVSTPLFEAAAIFAGDSEARWAAVRQAFFDEETYTAELWNQLGRFRPQAEGARRLALMASVRGLVPDRRDDFGAWWKWMRGRVAASEDPAADLNLMFAVSAFQSDAARFVEAGDLCRERGLDFDELGEFSRELRIRNYELHCLAAVGQWDRVVARWEAQLELTPQEPFHHAYLAAALRRAGRDDEARSRERVLERLALGEPNTCRQIGDVYANFGDFSLAGTWWLRAALHSVGDELEFSYAAEKLYLESKERGDWVRAASLGEMSLLAGVMGGRVLKDPAALLRNRIEIEMARAIARLDQDRDHSLEILERCHRSSITDGSLADYFFPVLRQVGLTDRHDRWFEESWRTYAEVIARFPGSHNTLNTAAWTAARANRRLDEAEVLSRRSLELLPDQPAYLDTLAEIWFSRGDRDQAVAWSDRAVAYASGLLGYETFVRQNERFRREPFPVD